MGDAHIVIIDHHGVHIGGRAVRAHDDEIIQVLSLEYDLALHMVVDGDVAAQRRLDADHRGNPVGSFALVAIAPVTVIAWRLAGGAGLFTHLV